MKTLKELTYATEAEFLKMKALTESGRYSFAKTTVKVGELILARKDISPRAQGITLEKTINQNIKNEYKQLLLAGMTFSEVAIIIADDYEVLDGNNIIAACKEAFGDNFELSVLKCEQKLSDADRIFITIMSNLFHGLRFSYTEISKAYYLINELTGPYTKQELFGPEYLKRIKALMTAYKPEFTEEDRELIEAVDAAIAASTTKSAPMTPPATTEKEEFKGRTKEEQELYDMVEKACSPPSRDEVDAQRVMRDIINDEELDEEIFAEGIDFEDTVTEADKTSASNRLKLVPELQKFASRNFLTGDIAGQIAEKLDKDKQAYMVRHLGGEIPELTSGEWKRLFKAADDDDAFESVVQTIVDKSEALKCHADEGFEVDKAIQRVLQSGVDPVYKERTLFNFKVLIDSAIRDFFVEHGKHKEQEVFSTEQYKEYVDFLVGFNQKLKLSPEEKERRREVLRDMFSAIW